jgi:hypothetical protein
VSSTTTNGGPGTAVVSMIFGPGTAPPVTLYLFGARFVGEVSATGFVDAQLAGAVSENQIQTDVIPAFAEGVRTVVAAECTGSPPPGCGCTPGSNGEQFISLFDDDQDCAITDDEVRDDPITMSFFEPDVTVGGVDGVSLGVLVTAVPAAFTPP